MKVKIQVVVESDNDDAQEIMLLEHDSLKPENLGLSLAEAKILLHNTQRNLVEQQVVELSFQQKSCLHCSKKLLHKGKREIVYWTLFGKLHLQSHRLFHCSCQKHSTRSFYPLANLLPEHTLPELLYLASLVSYGLSVKLLEEILPLEEHSVCSYKITDLSKKYFAVFLRNMYECEIGR